MLMIPVGFAHGYAVLSDEAECLYKCTNLYVAELEFGFQWNDPEMGRWPVRADPLRNATSTSPSFDRVHAGRYARMPKGNR